MEGRMSHFNRASKHKCDGKERNERTAQRQKRKGAKNISIASCSTEAGERLPLIGSLKTRATEKSIITIQAGKRKHAQSLISTALQNNFMAPWEGSSNSESSFISILSPPSPRPPPPIMSSEIFPNPPQAIRDTHSESEQSVHVKRRLLPLRRPSRPQRFPPLRQVTNLSFSRNFTFSFFELPWHQSVQNRANQLKEIVVLLRKIQY
ncbi:uncharacterized protein LOC132893250 [Neoarius graeffei]|uniref:uncharacterized protein LOC132893250 n=1 Tax=Neoarius graeffei TaxID=443677 RepID=UPI00298BFCD5|nr:uncharacterized protein LOC132893250 [Neoarius graeffei]